MELFESIWNVWFFGLGLMGSIVLQKQLELATKIPEG